MIRSKNVVLVINLAFGFVVFDRPSKPRIWIELARETGKAMKTNVLGPKCFRKQQNNIKSRFDGGGAAAFRGEGLGFSFSNRKSCYPAGGAVSPSVRCQARASTSLVGIRHVPLA